MCLSPWSPLACLQRTRKGKRKSRKAEFPGQGRYREASVLRSYAITALRTFRTIRDVGAAWRGANAITNTHGANVARHRSKPTWRTPMDPPSVRITSFLATGPVTKGLTTLAIVDTMSQFIASHVVDAKGGSAEHAIKQVLRDLRRMGHHGSLKVRMDQESSISDLFR